MKESFGGTWLFQIVILFILLFTAIMCLTINQSKAFAVKSEIINYIENRDGINLESTIDNGIIDIIQKAGYYTTGTCESGFTGYSRDGKKTSNNPVLCIRTISNNQETGGCYFEIKVFYRLDLPVIESAFNFKIGGKTKALYSKCSQ